MIDKILWYIVAFCIFFAICIAIVCGTVLFIKYTIEELRR